VAESDKTGVQVEVKPWQEDDDYSDEEGIFGFIPANQNTTRNKRKELSIACGSHCDSK
jgi:hypothetical protein